MGKASKSRAPAGARRPPPPEWRIEDGLVPYPDALAAMEARVAAIRAGRARERIWLVEHPPLYTAGTSAAADELLDPGALPVYQAGRGGRFTYHGPGQRVGYVMLDLKRRGSDLRWFVRRLEDWLIATLARFNVRGERREGRIGVWVIGADGVDRKIGAIGVRVRQWVTFHGVSLNVDPNLAHFSGIVPCGLGAFGVTSLVREGILVGMPEVDAALRATFADVFGADPVGQAAARSPTAA